MGNNTTRSSSLDLPDKFYYLADKYHHGLTEREKINIRIDPVYAIAHLAWVISTTCEPDALIQYRDLLAQYKRTSYYKELTKILA